MTLCIAWRDEETFHFISDSRLLIPYKTPIENVLKIVSLQVKISIPLLSTYHIMSQ